METYCDPQHVVMDETATMNWPTIVQRLLQCIEHEAGMGCSADPPTNDIADVNIDHERHVDEPVPGRHVGKIRDPKPIRGWRVELAVDVIQRTRCRLIADRGAHRLATDYPLQTHIAHQPLDGASGNAKPFARHLSPDLADAIDREVLGKDTRDFGLERNIALCPRRQAQWISSLCCAICL